MNVSAPLGLPRTLLMRGLVDCWTVWTTNIVLYCPVCVPPGRGDFLYVLRPVSPTQCRVGI